MVSVHAVYEDGKVTLLEDLPAVRRARLIVTVIDPIPPAATDATATGPAPVDLFDDLIGVIDLREDGAAGHDRYLVGQGK
ncbi:hypothetical protein [uncultured Thiodictyon sp.]|jgi:hypothetical protein|uniref:hypothetical protein n=1 Tax=uncultured Thiodictyon sp. TaxID=1846217 RepID=UPI0025D32CB5|nr:hypothetical protein [uncultured Thiodictyon sp.]